MCRWLAYAGSPITMDTLVTRPNHSLVLQSRLTRRNYVPGAAVTAQFRDHDFPTNGDGVGLGWYDRSATPGLYRDVLPAWGDANLAEIAEHQRSRLFLAHVRATLGGTISRSNNHPFLHGHWLYQYNGEISGFDRLKRTLTMDVAPELYPFIEGNADTEVTFYLALTYGLAQDPPRALARMVGRVERARREGGIAEPFRATLCCTDGTTIYAVRYASDDTAKTLYRSADLSSLAEAAGGRETLPPDARVLVSEPLELGFRREHWVEVPPSTLVTVRAGGDFVLEPFAPDE